jgi:hypothetical protein
MTTKEEPMSDRFVVVTTDSTRRGVFGGVLLEYDKDKGTAVLLQAQMAVSWSRETRGVLGLAAAGPVPGGYPIATRIGPPVPRLEIDGVTAVIDATDEARAEWVKQPWS